MADVVLPFERARYGLALGVKRAAYALPGPDALKHVLEDMGFRQVVVYAEGAAVPRAAVTLLDGLHRSFPEWITYAEASWAGPPTRLRAFNDLFDILRTAQIGNAADPVDPSAVRPAAGIVVAIGATAALAGVAWFVSYVTGAP